MSDLDFSTAKQDVTDIFNIVSTRGEKPKAAIMPGATEYVLGNVHVVDDESLRIIFTPNGSVTESKSYPKPGLLRFDRLDPLKLREIAEQLRKGP